ncbi:MAG TPA: polysaccharide deacetylase family protein, partial [Polyangiaceae bacterium]
RAVYDPDRFDSEVRRCQGQLESILGEPARFLRFPYGNRGHQDPGRIFRHYGLRCVHWTFSSLDSTARTPDRIVNRVETGLRAGAIVLFHDALADEGASLGRRYRSDRDATIAALPEVISRVRARGLRPVTMGNLPLRNPGPPS